ncbi:hypothetical protein, partial [Pseudescherichia sp.]
MLRRRQQKRRHKKPQRMRKPKP